jgi:hypothetical protein
VRYEDVADDRMVAIGTHHTVDGNRGRFRSGSMQLSEDVRWRQELDASDRALAIALTGPLLHRYGYLPRASSSTASVLDTI